MRIQKKFYIRDIRSFRNKALQWGCKSTHCCYLNGNAARYAYESFPELLAVGCKKEFLSDPSDYSSFLDNITTSKDWAFGFLGYNTREIQLKENGFFPNGLFFSPITLISFFPGNIISIESSEDPELILSEIVNSVAENENEISGSFHSSITRENYISVINRLKFHLQRGDIYQVNYCIKFEAEDLHCDPWLIYEKLNALSSMPFSGFLKAKEFCIVSASPERYLKKLNTKIISQPMKGTAPVYENEVENKYSISNLITSEKEIAENVMIVDLVRNDLSTICQDGSVKVETLCGLYTFKNVHQMVSTVVGTLNNVSASQIIEKTFPMGSMTGAPKIRAMQLIEENEITERGPFSGTMGYFDPNGNFDLNVLIRSLFYNKRSGKAFYEAGSGITHLSDPEKEYEECMLKAETIKQVFTNLN